MAMFSADSFAQLLNSYTLNTAPRRLSVPKGSQLATLRDVTVSGTLVHRRLTHIQPDGSRTEKVPAAGEQYVLEGDGDIHFCLGTVDDAVHVPCELQHAQDWLTTFNGAIGKQVAVSGLFRCLFEHPGFEPHDDAHIFEIHPVRAVDFGDGQGLVNVDVGRPDDPSIHQWLSPNNLNQSDNRMAVSYDAASDTATFSGFGQGDENYTEEPGQISNIDLTPGSPEPATFVFTGDHILNRDITSRPLTAYCLKNTTAARQLEALTNGARVTLLSLRNIDLRGTMSGQYVISLLAIDIQPISAATTGRRRGRRPTVRPPAAE